MKHELMTLPYSLNTLQPYMSQETLEYHHGKHHLAYVTTLNTLITGTEFQEKQLEDIIVNSQGKIFNNASQIWNHNILWNTLTDHESSQRSFDILHSENRKLFQLIESSFGSFENMKKTFKEQSLGRFGSGWVWLVQSGEKLEIYSSPNAENPLTLGGTTLLGLDVWEHAYYIDYRNDRGGFVDNFWNIVDWNVVEGRLN